jgi:hypothetical protein
VLTDTSRKLNGYGFTEVLRSSYLRVPVRQDEQVLIGHIDIEARVECIDSRTVRAPLTLREFTEKEIE